jgi:hypothetical protein
MDGYAKTGRGDEVKGNRFKGHEVLERGMRV